MSDDRAAAALRGRPPSVPKPPSNVALVALAVALAVAAVSFWVAEAVRRAMACGGIGTFPRGCMCGCPCSGICGCACVCVDGCACG